MSENNIGTHTFRLFDKPSFIRGMGSLLDFRPNIERYMTSDGGIEADCNALASDWYAVGDDMRDAIKLYEQEEKNILTLAD